MMGDIEQPTQAPLPGFLDGIPQEKTSVDHSLQDVQPPLSPDFLEHVPVEQPVDQSIDTGLQDSLPLEKYRDPSTASQSLLSSDFFGSNTIEQQEKEKRIILKTMECIKSLDLKTPSLTSEETDRIIEEVAKHRGIQNFLIRNFPKFIPQINKQIEEVVFTEGFIARGRVKEKEFIPFIATYTNHIDGMFILHRSIENNNLGNTYYLTRFVKKEYKDFIDARKFTVSENDDPNSPLYFEMIDFEYIGVPRYPCSPEIRKGILDLVKTEKPDGWKLKDLYNLM